MTSPSSPPHRYSVIGDRLHQALESGPYQLAPVLDPPALISECATGQGDLDDLCLLGPSWPARSGGRNRGTASPPSDRPTSPRSEPLYTKQEVAAARVVRASSTDRIRARIDELAAQDRELPEVLEDIARLGTQLLMQAVLEAEVTGFLDRDHYQRAAACADARPDSATGIGRSP
jgi:hypothetical protein